MPDIETQSFTLAGAEGQQISGNVHIPKTEGPLPVVVICHGFKGFKDYAWFPYVTERIAVMGYAAIRFDFSHNGMGEDLSTFARPDLFRTNTWSKEMHDLSIIINRVHAGALPFGTQMDTKRLAVFGHSKGGTTVHLAAGEDDRIKAVITLASRATSDMLSEEWKDMLRQGQAIPIPSSRTGQTLEIGPTFLEDLENHAEKLDQAGAIQRASQPFLVLHGDEDPTVPVQDAQTIADLRGDRPTRLHILAHGNHNLGTKHPFEGTSDLWEEALDVIKAFLEEYL